MHQHTSATTEYWITIFTENLLHPVASPFPHRTLFEYIRYGNNSKKYSVAYKLSCAYIKTISCLAPENVFKDDHTHIYIYRLIPTSFLWYSQYKIRYHHTAVHSTVVVVVSYSPIYARVRGCPQNNIKATTIINILFCRIICIRFVYICFFLFARTHKFIELKCT